MNRSCRYNKDGSGEASDPDDPPTSASATVESFDSDGNPAELLAVPSGSIDVVGGLESVSSQGVSLVGQATRSASTLPNNPFPDDPDDGVQGTSVGWVRIRSEANLHVEATISIRDIETNKIVTTVTVTGKTAKKTWEFKAHSELKPSPGQETIRTGMAILNPLEGGKTAMIEIRPLDGTLGNLIGEPIKISLAPGEQTSKFLDELAPGIRDFWGKVKITSDVPVVVLPLVQEGLPLTSQQVDGE